ncbi:MAG: hydroxymethylbilane synthase [Planctomycetes bacterium]|nr:hydroxymethylbilane synthase [Planctomycetota bacterium]MCB9900817.1 hydroxymethylbilane synthase [Planctomycetota bacterium]
MIRLGTRASQLALTQSGTIADALRARGADVEIVRIETAGDRDRTSAFAAIGTAGIFVRELERALLDGRIDLAVHSYKDLPSAMPEGLVVAAVPTRADPRDRLLVLDDAFRADAPGLPVRDGARVGTSAARRTALVHALRPDVEALPLRGNVPTRVEKLVRGDYDAIVLAGAGLDRLAADGFTVPAGIVVVDLEAREFVPAPSQGALALQVRALDGTTREAVAALDDPRTSRPVAVERALLEALDAGCSVAFGGWCEPLRGEHLRLHGLLEVDGMLRRAVEESVDETLLVTRVHDALRAPRHEVTS